MKAIYRLGSAVALSSLLTGCGLWSSEAEVEPAELVDFDAEYKVDVLWSEQIGDGLGEQFQLFAPVLAGQQIIAADLDGVVEALSRENGDTLWETDLDTRLSGGVGAGFGKLAVATTKGELIVLDAEKGTELWRTQMATEAVAVPQFNAELVVVQLINGELAAYDSTSGQQRWNYDSQAPRLTLRGTSSPIVAANVTLAGFANGDLVALNNNSGVPVWRQKIAEPSGRTELERMVDIDGRFVLSPDGKLYAASYQGQLTAISPYNGQLLWRQPVSSYRSLAQGFGNVYVSEANGFVQAFDTDSSASVWQQKALENRGVTAPAVLGTHLAVGDAEGYLHFMSQLDGHFVARKKIDSDGLSADMLVSDDVLYLQSNGGRLVALQLK